MKLNTKSKSNGKSTSKNRKKFSEKRPRSKITGSFIAKEGNIDEK